ncbi:ABC transporter permease [Sinomicrobium soli]|uniref:ABC transporter permease n=1 Tax=Sinomicrobium sp. N-1-3-6 TaxID=2219864 RepID=UPI000DCAE466|nr:ABC transporter permease [Sinomicrobium sp. N-1-3-6]RAV30634.1 ABC transporter permease [Sinomicrobium sp. N-1-3-6]
MIRNYLKIAWRNLWNSKYYTAMGILGLATGLSTGIFILLWVQSELRYNAFDQSAGQIYHVGSDMSSGDDYTVWSTTPGPVAFHATKDVPGIVHAVRVRTNWNYSVYSFDNNHFEKETAAYTDPDFFALFQTRFLHGNPEQPFKGNKSVVITKSAATRFFGSQNPIGKMITGDYKDTYTVTGVIEDLPTDSSLDYHIFFPVSLMDQFYVNSTYWNSKDSDWGNFNYETYLQLAPGISPATIESKLTDIQQKNDPNATPLFSGKAYHLQPVSEMNLYDANGAPSGIQTVRIFIVALFLILLIASINYINISTARAMKRAKEVSIRKIIGAGKKQLFFQFITESVLFFGLSGLLALGCILLLRPYFDEISGKELQISLFNKELWKVLFYTFAATLLVSSIYPALFLTSFRPLQAIKGKILPGARTTSFRKVLVTVQFVFSIILISGTLIIGKQLKYMKSKDPGYNRSQILTFYLQGEMSRHSAAIKNQVENMPGVKGVSFSSNYILNNGNTTGDTDWDGKKPQSDFIVNPFGMDANFIPLMQMELVAGQNFTGTPSDSTHYILNETAVKLAGIKDPVGKRFSLWETEGIIIGVIKDFNYTSMKHKIGPSVIYYAPDASRIYIKINGREAKDAIAGLQKIWNNYNSGFSFNYSFLDDAFDKMYRSEIRTAKIFNIFSVIAIFVSCLGLFALTTYTTQMKRGEIGVRKVLGASVFQITRYLTTGFLKLVVLSGIIAIPLAWYLMQWWLQSFAYKAAIGWYLYAMAIILVILVAAITMSFQTVKAAMENPTKSLREQG